MEPPAKIRRTVALIIADGKRRSAHRLVELLEVGTLAQGARRIPAVFFRGEERRNVNRVPVVHAAQPQPEVLGPRLRQVRDGGEGIGIREGREAVSGGAG